MLDFGVASSACLTGFCLVVVRCISHSACQAIVHSTPDFRLDNYIC